MKQHAGVLGGGGVDKEEVCVRICIMRTDCRSEIQSTDELNGFWERGIVQVMCFNKMPSLEPLLSLLMCSVPCLNVKCLHS